MEFLSVLLFLILTLTIIFFVRKSRKSQDVEIADKSTSTGFVFFDEINRVHSKVLTPFLEEFEHGSNEE